MGGECTPPQFHMNGIEYFKVQNLRFGGLQFLGKIPDFLEGCYY